MMMVVCYDDGEDGGGGSGVVEVARGGECKGGDMGGGGVIATAVSRGDGGDGEVMERVRESEVSGWIDRLTRNIFGVHRKTPPEKFSGGGGGGRRCDGGNTGEGVKIASGVIGSGDEIESSEELKDLLPAEARK
ncbi:hypothetical protein Tco_1154340 [Tanacetum coccineum]